MNILDIKFMGDNAYLLKSYKITAGELEQTIKAFDYNELYSEYRNYKDENGVEKAQFPPINFVFYQFVFENDSIPSPQKVIDLYFELYEDNIKVADGNAEMNGVIYNLNALKARILRTYPSLLRDFHFYLMLKECNCFDKVIYSCADDIKGTDITIVYKNKKYVISLFTDTKRSWSFKRIKDIFRHRYGKNEIKVPMVLDKADQCGDFMLYKESDVEYVKKNVLK